jgi:hypothetical protein
MTAHVYRRNTRLVLMGRIKVADWRNELRHLELSLPVAEGLMAKLADEDNELRLNAKELVDLLQGKGEIADYVKLSASAEKVTRTLTALTKVAWEHEVPFSVDEIERADGDEYFDSFSAAYLVDGSVRQHGPESEEEGANG